MSSSPTTYTPAYNFTGFQAAAPGTPLPADMLDAELQLIRTSVNALISRLAEIQRSDGPLRNASVHPDALDPATLLLLGSETWVARGAWVTATAYAVGDLITNAGAVYVGLVAHTSGTFATDLAAAKWMTITQAVAASAVPFTPAGGVAAATVQLAIEEVDSEAAKKAANLSDLASVLTARQNLRVIANERTAAKTASYAFAAADCGKLVPVTASGAAWTQTLTAAATVGAGFVIGFQKTDATYYGITIDGNSAETINGVADFLLTDQYETVWLMCDGSNWQVIGYVAGQTSKNDVIIEQQTAAVSSAIDFLKGWTTTRKFRRMVFEWEGYYPSSTGELQIRVSKDAGSTFESTTYHEAGLLGTTGSAAAGFGSAVATKMRGSPNSIANGVTGACAGSLIMADYEKTDRAKRCKVWATSFDATNTGYLDHTSSWHGGTQAITGLRFLPSAGTMTAGVFTQKGVY